MTHIEDRRNALRSFIAKQGGFAAVTAKFKLSQSQASYLSQLTAKNSVASFGEKSAKNWEHRLGLSADVLVRPSAENDNSIANASLASALPHPAPTRADTLTQLGQVIAASDKLTRAQIKPILDQLLETPEQAAELGARLEATIAIQQRPETSLPTPTADQVLTAKPIIRTSDFAPKVPAKP